MLENRQGNVVSVSFQFFDGASEKVEVRMARLELAWLKATRPSSVRVYRFHHIRMDGLIWSPSFIIGDRFLAEKTPREIF